MNIVFAGFLSLIFWGCAHTAVKEDFEIKLSGISSDSRFKKMKEDQYQITFDDASLIKIFRYKFENDKDVQTYLMNRRMILHQNFQNNIAPYFGLMETDQSCVARANIKGEIVPVAGGEHFFMEFPVTSERVISDCGKNDVWGTMTYHFYNCKAGVEVYEIRYSRPLNAEPFEIKSVCD